MELDRFLPLLLFAIFWWVLSRRKSRAGKGRQRPSATTGSRRRPEYHVRPGTRARPVGVGSSIPQPAADQQDSAGRKTIPAARLPPADGSRRLPALLAGSSVRQGVVWTEILGPPRSLSDPWE